MERIVRLTIAYDGTDFHGWQRQPGRRTVQEELENVARRVCGHALDASGAGRTDSGVHAAGQVVHFATTTRIPTENLAHALGHRLPPDIAIIHAADAPADFHASRSAKSKLYRYRIYHGPTPPVDARLQRYAFHCWTRLEDERLRAAAGLLIGRHDFAGFASQGSPRATTVRTISRVDVRRVGREVLIDVAGDGFLYRQVRNMVGTLLEIARGHWPEERISEVLASGDRRLAGPTAAARGLCLQWVRY
ncbi:MAG: tRNA pseudouridine synthase A [Phycisphaerae bacterium]|nr:tRNA pseudouridine synthase A [Phycisphaerae bacterium]